MRATALASRESWYSERSCTPLCTVVRALAVSLSERSVCAPTGLRRDLRFTETPCDGSAGLPGAFKGAHAIPTGDDVGERAQCGLYLRNGARILGDEVTVL
jgi:hypothetical protein